jgi:hypothetical protein
MSNEILCGGCGKVYPLWIAVNAKPANCGECGTQVEQRHVEQSHVEQHEVERQLSGGGGKGNPMWVLGGLLAMALLMLVLCGGGAGAYYYMMTPQAAGPDGENSIEENPPNVDEGKGNPDEGNPDEGNPATDKAATDKAATDKPATDKPATDKPATDKPATDKPATDKPATDKPATDKPATDKPATDKPATDKPATDKPATDKPATDKPAMEKAAMEKAAMEKAAMEKAAMEKAAVEKAAAEKAVKEGSATEKSASKIPVFVLNETPIGSALSGRENGKKQALLAAYDGTESTESAVIRGLEWLKRNQFSDGMWSLTGKYSQGALYENRTAATAMALLAFQGHGSTHKSGTYQAVVARGWNALLKKQYAEGNFFFTGGSSHRLYTHALATIALCEVYGMTKDETFKAPAEKALSYCFSSQSPQGGWRYRPEGASDTSVTGWFLLALQSGRMAGLTVPSVNLGRISVYLDTATDAGIRYAYKPGHPDTLSMTAEGLLCRQYLGWEKTDARLVKGLDYLGRNPIRFTKTKMDVYYWYYATQAMHHMGGEHWKQWNSVMRESIPKEQLKTGDERGSWDPSRDTHRSAGRMYTTCLCIYMLEVYYRHLPIYKHSLK